MCQQLCPSTFFRKTPRGTVVTFLYVQCDIKHDQTFVSQQVTIVIENDWKAVLGPSHHSLKKHRLPKTG